MFAAFAYIRPKTMIDAVAALDENGAHPHSGGTDLLPCMRENVMDVKTVVGMSDVPGLSGVRRMGSGLQIGAMTTLTETAQREEIRGGYTALAEAAEAAASPQIRNQGTIGGNLCQKPRCWYYRGEFDCIRKGGPTCYAVGGENAYHCILGGQDCYIVHPSDTAPALIALQAQVNLIGPQGKRTVEAEDFFVLPAVDPTRETVLQQGEIVTGVTLPARKGELRSGYRKIRTRRSWDFALAGLAYALRMEGDVVREARIAFSGVAPTPWRSQAVEEALLGKTLSAETKQKAAQAAVAGAKPMSQNAYKIDLMRGVVMDALP